MSKPLAITDVVLRDAHQSLFATRMRIEDMLPIAAELDKVGYWSLETWGGATFDSCIRFLGEDPWERLRELKESNAKYADADVTCAARIYWATVTMLMMWSKSLSSVLMLMGWMCSVSLTR